MRTPSVAIIDTLNSLLEAEANSVFHFVGSDSPYLASASDDVRRTLQQFSRHLDQHQRELAALITGLGGVPSIPPLPDPEEQYLSYLSLKFLLPKLVEAKELMISRHQGALSTIGGNSMVASELQRHLTQMQKDLDILRKTAAVVAAGGGSRVTT